MKRIALLGLVGCVVMGCSGEATGPAASIVGSWSLSTINGAGLPELLFQNASGTTEFTDDAFTFTSGLQYFELGHVRNMLTGGGSTTTAQGDTGTYTYSTATGTLIFTSMIGEGVDTATVVGSKLTLVFQGKTYVYVRP